MKFNNPYITVKTQIRMLQRWVLVHSFIYYRLDKNVVSDAVYDRNTQQLIKLQEENPEVKTEYHYVFKDFTSGTGFDLIPKLKEKHFRKIEADAFLIVRISTGQKHKSRKR